MRNLRANALVLAVCCSTALAGGLKTEQVAGDARWVAHVDVAAMLKSGLAQFVLQEAEKKDSFLEGIANFRKTFGFDPLSDVRSLTLYGKEIGPEDGVVILDATVNREKILALLTANETYKSHEYGDYVVHQWTDKPKAGADGDAPVKEPKTHFGCFYDEKTVLVASTLELLKGEIDVLNGKSGSLAKSEALKVLPKPLAGAFALAAAEGLKVSAGAKPQQAALMRHVRDVAVQLGEAEGRTFLSITALAETAQRAVKLRQVIQGFVALWQMTMAEKQDAPDLGETVEVSGEGNVVHVAAAAPTKSLIEMIKFLAERKKEAAVRAARKKTAEVRQQLIKARSRDRETG